MAQQFDLAHLRVTGNPFAIASNVEYWSPKGIGNFSVSQNGVLVYRAAFQSVTQPLWLDRFGKRLDSVGEPGYYAIGRLSPDGH